MVIWVTHYGLATHKAKVNWVNIGSGHAFFAMLHHAITGTNVDLSLVRSSGNHLRAISQEKTISW